SEDAGIDASEDASTPDAGTPDANAPDVVSDGADAGCPDALGTFAVNNAQGLLCGDYSELASQEIRSAGQACSLNFISPNDAGVGPGINGGATLGSDGTFSGATLTLGTVARSPCAGTWSEVNQEITVVCGNPGNDCL